MLISALTITTSMSSTVRAEDTPAPSVASPATPPKACAKQFDLLGKASTQQLAKFRTDPKGLLATASIGGLQMSSEVKALTLADPEDAVDALLTNAHSANSAQVAAIGTGLGLAMKLIKTVDQACADEIAQKIAGSGLTDLLAGFKLAAADTQQLLGPGLSSSSGGGLGGPVGGVGVETSSGTPTSTTTSSTYANAADTFGFSGRSISNGSTTIYCTNSVSPTRKC